MARRLARRATALVTLACVASTLAVLLPAGSPASAATYVTDTVLVSVPDGGGQMTDSLVNQENYVSDDGRHVAFLSNDPNLVPGDTNGQADLFVREVATGHTELVSRATDGQVTSSISGGELHVSAVAADASGVERVVVLFTTGGSTWQLLELADGAGDSWSGSVAVPPGTTGAELIVQALDGAGNVGVSAHKGRLFHAEPPSRVSIAASAFGEGAAGVRSVDVPVSLDRARDEAVTVEYTTGDGTARAPSDYGSASGTLTFAPGDTTETIPVQIVGDDRLEANETVTIALRSPAGALLGNASALLTITNDDVDLPPVAHAGDDKKIAAKNPFGLQGSASQDPEGGPLTYQWVQLTGPAVVLTDADKAKARVAGNRPKQTLTFRLTVTDANGASSTDTITVSPK